MSELETDAVLIKRAQKAYFMSALDMLNETNPNGVFELPNIAEQAAQLDPLFEIKISAADAIRQLLGRLDKETIQQKQRRAYLAPHTAGRIMTELVKMGRATQAEMTFSAMEGGNYHRLPNHNSTLYGYVPLRLSS